MDEAQRPTRQTAPRFPGFDGLRALAAVSVFFYHLVARDGRPLSSHWGKYVFVMNLGVPMFFMLSGFLLYRPFVAARFHGQRSLSTREFWRRRALRILPGFWVALTVLCLVFSVNEAPMRT